MPIEIRELHIKVMVDASTSTSPEGAAEPPSTEGSESDREAIVAECVEQVLYILREKMER